MALDDLDINIAIQSPELRELMGDLLKSLSISNVSIANMEAGYRGVAAALLELNRLANAQNKSLDFARVRMNSMLSASGALNKQHRTFLNTVRAIYAATQNVDLAMALARQRETWTQIQRMIVSSRTNLVKYNAEAGRSKVVLDAQFRNVQQSASRSSGLIVRPQPERQQAVGGGGLIKLATMALTVRALTDTRRVLQTTRVAVSDISRTATVATSAMDRFRLGLLAPKVDPSLNVVKTGLQSIATTTASVIGTLRGVADAVAADLPGAFGAAAVGAASVNNVLKDTSLTAAKYISQMESLNSGLNLLRTVFPGTGSAIEQFQTPLKQVIEFAANASGELDTLRAKVGKAAVTARNTQFVMGGGFQKLNSGDAATTADVSQGDSTDLFARAHFHALVPLRLLKRETEGATRVVRAAQHAWNFVSHPIHAAAVRAQIAHAEFKKLRSLLPELNSGLQIGTRAHRAFAHATYFTASALRAVGKVLSPITWTAGKLWNLVRPAKAAQTAVDGLNGSAQRAGFVLRNVTRAADGTFQSLTKVGRSGASAASSGLGSLISQARLGTVALGVMAASGVAFGVKMAASAETSRVVFGTMLKDMDQGRQLLADMQNWSGAPMFDAKAIEDTGRALIKAGVAPAGLVEKMDQLGNIATATKQPIEDLARWYQRGMSVGRFGQGAVNDLAERGVDIYHALESVTGKSGVALQQLMEAGKIGPAEMNAALEHLTTGTGIYAGALANVSQTSEGLWARMKNNVLQALGSLMGVGLEAFKPFMAKAVAATELVKTSITAIQPVLMQVVGAMNAALNGVWSVVSAVFGGIGLAGAMSFQYLLDLGLTWATRFRWFFENFGTLAQFAFSKMALFAVSSGNDIAYLFTDQIPNYLNWFGENWANVLIDAGNLTASVFENMGTNIVSAMTEIWDFIASGGTDSLEFAWTPLTAGFQKTVSELPKIPARALSQLELEMQASVENLGTTLANGYDAAMRDATATLPEMPKVTLSNQGATESGGMDTTAGGGQRRTSFLVEALDRGSQAALNAIFASQGRGSGTPEKQLSEQKKQTGLLQKIANRPAPRIAPAV